MGIGVWLHLTEHHEHEHDHEPWSTRIHTCTMNTISTRMDRATHRESRTRTSIAMSG